MNRFQGRAWVIVAFVSAIFTAVASGQCKEPPAEKKSEVSSYVMKKNQVSSSANLTLVSNGKANESCYWKFEYLVAPSKRTVVVYLSPDGHYLLPTLYDMRVDPAVELRAKYEKTMKQLTAGSKMQTGAADGKVEIVEFSDFECPFCRRLTDVLEKEVLPKENGRVNLVFRSFPLPMHPWAKQAAEMAECAALQNPESFWAMHDFLFQNQASLKPDTLKEQVLAFASTEKSLDQKQFASCVDMDLGMGPVAKDQKMGQDMGVQGTPTFWVNGVRFDGVRSASELETIIDQAAKGELVGPPEEAIVASVAPRAAAPASGTACAPAVRGGVNAQ